MIVSKNKVVAIEYHLTGSDGEVIDSSRGEEPLLYLHGFGNIIPGLENALEGKQTGDRFSVTVAPEEGYGLRSDELIQSFHRDDFEDADEIEVGMQFELPEEEGGQLFTIADINGDEVLIDANHPLAGQTLHFEIVVGEIRDATPEEIEHEHAHYPDEDEFEDDEFEDYESDDEEE